jgi:hypothetical protein
MLRLQLLEEQVNPKRKKLHLLHHQRSLRKRKKRKRKRRKSVTQGARPLHRLVLL